MSTWISSRSPAFSNCWMVLAPWTPTDPPAAAVLAWFTALSMPSVTKCTVELGRGHPAGTWWVSTNAGAQAWLPPQPWATSKVRRPVSMAPSPDVRPRRCSALGSDTLNVMGSDPPVWISTSPELMYQSNTSATPSRSEEHTSELQSRLHLVCRLLLEKKK